MNSKCEQFPVCRWQEWWLVWSSAAVLLQCVVLLEMLLCIPWFRWTATWVSFSFLSVQISLATLLWPTEFLHTEYFLFSDHSLKNPSISAFSEIFRPARLVPTTMPPSKSLKSPFCSYSKAWIKLQQVIWSIFTFLNGHVMSYDWLNRYLH